MADKKSTGMPSTAANRAGELERMAGLADSIEGHAFELEALLTAIERMGAQDAAYGAAPDKTVASLSRLSRHIIGQCREKAEQIRDGLCDLAFTNQGHA